MGILLTNIEFFTHEREVWYRCLDGPIHRLTESDHDLIESIVEHIDTFYPKAYAALADEYKGSVRNQSYFRFLIASRFIRCNFAPLDNVPDFSAASLSSFEFVPCPLRGECRLECVVCRPEFDHKLSAAELRVMRLWCQGQSEDEIARQLYLSPCTIHNHIANAYNRTGIHSRHEFVAYASKHNLFS